MSRPDRRRPSPVDSDPRHHQRGTRIWVGLVLGMLAHGTTIETLLAEYPQLDEVDVRACLAYGAKLANGRPALCAT